MGRKDALYLSDNGENFIDKHSIQYLLFSSKNFYREISLVLR